MSEINIYLGLAITGFFTGIGTIMSQYIFKEFIEPKMKIINTDEEKKKKLWRTIKVVVAIILILMFVGVIIK